MTQINIEIVSDTVCPWCYIGKRQLDKAIETWKEKYPERNDIFNITWKPFYLNPDAPKKGMFLVFFLSSPSALILIFYLLSYGLDTK